MGVGGHGSLAEIMNKQITVLRQKKPSELLEVG